MPDARADTIAAVATATGRAALAIVRVSGPAALRVAATLAGPLPPPRHAALRTFRAADGAVLDKGVLLTFVAPQSSTGEDCVEFQGHGGPAVIAAVLAAVVAQPGCRLAQPGEFTRRAFLNGRMDLAAVEALGDLVEAETEAQRQQALQAQTLGPLVEMWRAALIEAMALLAAEIDFADEGEAPDETRAAARAAAAPVAAAIRTLVKDAGRAEIVRDGFTVVIAGPPNAGKSTLLNALAGREAALVSAIAGTTRDLIEVRLDLDSLLVHLVDTAGLREADDPVEQAGILRARERAASADLVLWLHPADATDSAPPQARDVLTVRTKADLGVGEPQALAISARTGEGIPVLVDELARRARSAAGPLESRLMTRARHRKALTRTLTILDDTLADPDRAIEILADDLQAAAQALATIVGRIDVEAVLDDVFSRFCLGK